MKKPNPNPDADLKLLLTDYSVQRRSLLVPAAPGGKAGERGPRPAAPAGPRHNLHLLVEDFPLRAKDWWEGFDPEKPPRLPRQAPGQRDLTLLAESDGLVERTLSGLKALTEGGPSALASRSLTSDSGAAPALGGQDPPLDLLLHWQDEYASSRWRAASRWSLAIHALMVGFLIVQARVFPHLPRRQDDGAERMTITLLAPPPDLLRQLTQPVPREGPVTVAFEGKMEAAAPVVAPPEEIAPGAPVILEPEPEPPRAEPPEPELEPEPPVAEESPEPAASEPALAEVASPPAAQSPHPGEFTPGRRIGRPGNPAELPMPRRPSRRPQLVLEQPKSASPGRPGEFKMGDLALNAGAGNVVEAAVRNLSSGRTRVRQAVGDDFNTGIPSGYMRPSPGNAGSKLELLSDPKGVDFRPYLRQVLLSVRRNWYAVIPESARLGMTRGQVLIQLAIVRDGTVAKLVIASSSGVNSLDRAAVAGISASNPFPPPPSEYTGKDVRIQFGFRYNTNRR